MIPPRTRRRIPSRRTVALCLEVFPGLLARGASCGRQQRSTHGVAPPTEYGRRQAAALMVGMPRGASHEVHGSYSTCQRRSPPAARPPPKRPARSVAGLPHPLRSVLRVSTLATVCSSDEARDRSRAPLPPARRISGGSAHGVPDPAELSPRPEPWRLSTPVAFLPFATRAESHDRMHRRPWAAGVRSREQAG